LESEYEEERRDNKELMQIGMGFQDVDAVIERILREMRVGGGTGRGWGNRKEKPK
jgi:hypothetical protein